MAWANVIPQPVTGGFASCTSPYAPARYAGTQGRGMGSGGAGPVLLGAAFDVGAAASDPSLCGEGAMSASLVSPPPGLSPAQSRFNLRSCGSGMGMGPDLASASSSSNKHYFVQCAASTNFGDMGGGSGGGVARVEPQSHSMVPPPQWCDTMPPSCRTSNVCRQTPSSSGSISGAPSQAGNSANSMTAAAGFGAAAAIQAFDVNQGGQAASKDGWHSDVTTVMIRHVPRIYTDEALSYELIKAGITVEAYNFIYLPWDNTRDSNAGYAFVNFVDPAIAREVGNRLDGTRWKLVQSFKEIKVVSAHVQGFVQSILHYLNRLVNDDAHQHRMHTPKVYLDGVNIPFWKAAKLYCPRDLQRAGLNDIPKDELHSESARSSKCVISEQDEKAGGGDATVQASCNSSASCCCLSQQYLGLRSRMLPLMDKQDAINQLRASTAYKAAWASFNLQLQELKPKYIGDDAKTESVTTVMIQNVPRSYLEDALIRELELAQADSRSYNFLYLPWDNTRNSNAGYAFVNFVNPSTATRAIQRLDGSSWRLVKSPKEIKVVPAHVQGLAPSINHYVNKSVVEDGNVHQPMVYFNGQRISFRKAVKAICPQHLDKLSTKYDSDDAEDEVSTVAPSSRETSTDSMMSGTKGASKHEIAVFGVECLCRSEKYGHLFQQLKKQQDEAAWSRQVRSTPEYRAAWTRLSEQLKVVAAAYNATIDKNAWKQGNF